MKFKKYIFGSCNNVNTNNANIANNANNAPPAAAKSLNILHNR